MEFRQIRYALAVAKERSFTRAATRLNVSQSAISEQVRLLEGRIGFPLFRRTGRGVEVTDAGRAYLAEAQRVVGDLMSLDDVARRLKGQNQETITLGLGSGMAPLIVPPLFGGPHRASAPRSLRIDLRTAPTRVVFNELFEERLDAAFAVNADPERIPAGLVSERLCELEMLLILPPGHRFARLRQPLDLARAFSEPLIMSELGVGYGQIVTEQFEALGVRPSVVSVVDNIETQLVMVRCGAGVALVPAGAAALDLARCTVVGLRVSPAPRFDLSFYKRRQPLSRDKEAVLAKIPETVRRHLTSSSGTQPG